MDRAVIYGAFQFIGFQFCCSLLDQGCEVIGIHANDKDIDIQLSEKKMEIGRNANFYEMSPSEWLDQEEFSEQTLVILDNYNFIINNQGDMNIENSLGEFFNRNREKIEKTDSKIVSLFPIQFLLQPNEAIKSNPAISNRVHRIFLPTIYGPWQPNDFLFQQYLLKTILPDTRISPNKFEWIHDTLYIEDIVDPIIKLTEHKAAESWILKSDTPDHWQKCADHLSIPHEEVAKIRSEALHHQGTIKEFEVKSITHYSEGLEKQKQQLKLFHHLDI